MAICYCRGQISVTNNITSGRHTRWLVILLTLCAICALMWWFVSKPVLVHTNVLKRADDQPCREDDARRTGITILSPLRSRHPERIADGFMREASNSVCSPNLSAELCGFVRQHPLPASRWRPNFPAREGIRQRSSGGGTDVCVGMCRPSKGELA